MKDLKKLSLNKEVKKEAEEIEKEVESRSDLDDIKVSDDMETSLFNKIQEYEYDKRLKKVHYRRKRRYLILQEKTPLSHRGAGSSDCSCVR